ncbi:hypothetical protein PYJP_20450 [Pyrofollis japonicus]|uniref:hypothetical protein n=1 Tax=Pyrofollis japonicus TaxID=3060460 RepID=UPI00295A9EEF|nr:hypothetical protein [Pyrofollis japonicus]BEP18693.1 hypothetical protein PYJP_20450 [Pyrofollis japonicus]
MEENKGAELGLRAYAVLLILKGETENALRVLSEYYGIATPRLKVGLPKRHAKALGCYDARRRLICLRSSNEYRNPFVVLHEFYHHLRSCRAEFAGSEKNANNYALESIRLCLYIYGEECEKLIRSLKE